MNRSAPAPSGRPGPLVAVVAAALALAAPAGAQEIVHPRTPSVSFRPTPLASELAALPQAAQLPESQADARGRDQYQREEDEEPRA